MKIYLCFFIVALASCCTLACDTSRQPVNPETGSKPAAEEFDKQGHRGSRGLMPENTIPAMIKAIDLGVTTLEMDVVITADRKVILSHDQHYNSDITTVEGGMPIIKSNQDSFAIYKMTYDQTLKYDVGLKPYAAFPRQQKLKVTKPLLSDVIDSVEKYIALKGKAPVQYNIETKSGPKGDNVLHPAPAEYVNLIMGVIKDKNVSERTIIQSFDFRTLQVMHQKYPGIRLAALVQSAKPVSEYLKELGFTPTIYSPYFSMVNAGLVEECHKLKMKVIPWTVNDKAKIEELRKLGVDGIITDYPDLF